MDVFAGVSDWNGSMEQGRSISPSWSMGDPGERRELRSTNWFLPGGPPKPVISGVMGPL